MPLVLFRTWDNGALQPVAKMSITTKNTNLIKPDHDNKISKNDEHVFFFHLFLSHKLRREKKT